MASGLIAVLAALVVPVSADAATDTAPDFDPPSVSTVHIELPLTAVTNMQSAVAVSIVNISLAHRFAGLVEVEAGGGMLTALCHSGPAFTGRTGLSPSLLTARPEGSHWNLRIPLLVSYTYYSGSGGGNGGGCEYPISQKFHAVTASTGIEATHWSVANTAFNMRLLGGVGRGWSIETSSNGVWDSWRASESAVNLSLSIGLAFR